jgi:hypothetical protein
VGKIPSFVDLLTPELQRFKAPSEPLAMARCVGEQTQEQKRIASNRDKIWDEDGKQWWEDKGYTWGKIPDKDKARICQRMFDSIGWSWQVSMQRTIERISYWRGKGGRMSQRRVMDLTDPETPTVSMPAPTHLQPCILLLAPLHIRTSYSCAGQRNPRSTDGAPKHFTRPFLLFPHYLNGCPVRCG